MSASSWKGFTAATCFIWSERTRWATATDFWGFKGGCWHRIAVIDYRSCRCWSNDGNFSYGLLIPPKFSPLPSPRLPSSTYNFWSALLYSLRMPTASSPRLPFPSNYASNARFLQVSTHRSHISPSWRSCALSSSSIRSFCVSIFMSFRGTSLGKNRNRGLEAFGCRIRDRFLRFFGGRGIDLSHAQLEAWSAT